MADIRTTFGRRSRVEGTQVGIRLNTFGMSKLEESVTGDILANIAVEALQPSLEEAYSEWPVLTGASRDSLVVETIEIGPHMARAALQVGGPRLMNDSRNKSGKDYAPFIEFNGTATAPPGIILNAVINRMEDIRRELHSRVAELVRGSL